MFSAAPDLEMNMEEFDARMLLDQFMLELQFDLQDDGFNVSRIDFIGDCRVSADTMYLKRVFVICCQTCASMRTSRGR